MTHSSMFNGWEMREPGKPLVPVSRPLPVPAAGQVRLRIAGTGVCHTDVSFLYGGVRTRKPLPIILGHEIAGIVDAAGEGAEAWLGRGVVVPAVIPCGQCELCLKGRGAICASQVFPGSDADGGFASHVLVPAHALARVDLGDAGLQGEIGRSGVGLAEHAVVADAVSTAYQAIRKSRLGHGSLAVFVGAGGVGGFGVQIAAALGALPVAIDVNARRLDLLSEHGAALTILAGERDPDEIRQGVRDFARARGLAASEWRIFETSGTRSGQELAFRLLGPGAYLGVVGYTREAASLRLSNLMAFDAVAEGTWGCAPDLYPEVLRLVRAGKVKLEPFVERRPLADVNQVLDAMHHGGLDRRVVLIP